MEAIKNAALVSYFLLMLLVAPTWGQEPFPPEPFPPAPGPSPPEPFPPAPGPFPPEPFPPAPGPSRPGRQCMSPCISCHGFCYSGTKCTAKCVAEGFTGGHCMVKALSRACMCQKPCALRQDTVADGLSETNK